MRSRKQKTGWRDPSLLLGAAFAAFSLGALSWSCSATHDETSSTTGGAAGAGASGGTGATGGLDLDAGGGDGSIDEDAACVKAVIEAAPIPLDMAILVDQSGSMGEDGKWTGTTAALESFIDDPASAGIGVGITFFPVDSETTTCDYHDYATPAVPIAPLPDNAPALFSAIEGTGPAGNTPMYGALKGALLGASAYRDAHPGHTVVLVLSSDGLPGSCDPGQNDVAAVATIAASAHAIGIDTYVIALSGTDVDGLGQIASAGGTVAAYDVTADVSQFAAKMAEIRGAAGACDYQLPPPPAGEQLDLDVVNVTYSPTGQDEGTLLPRAENLPDCGNAPGWYYDSLVQPTKIILCPASCTAAKTTPASSVKVLIGCATVLN